MAAAQDLYGMLGVPLSATSEDIRAAYRALTRRLHPDVNGSVGAANQYRDINNAYMILGDPMERQKHDLAMGRRDGSQPFQVRVVLSQRAVHVLDEPQVLYMYVEVQADATKAHENRDAWLNLTLVLDQSTSMKGQRLERVKVAASHIIDQLSDKDIFSVVTFSDAADVLVKAGPVTDRTALKGRVALMQAFGGTEIFQGLTKGLAENQRYANKKYVNHIILITDGRTFGDEQQSLDLAERALKEGIGISAMGIGEDWNDTFLDQLGARTGGTSEYIGNAAAVDRFMNERVRTLGQAYAERLTISVAPDPDIVVESAFRLLPSAQPLLVDRDPIPLGALNANLGAAVLFQLQLAPQRVQTIRSLVRIDVTGDMLREQRLGVKEIADMAIEVSEDITPEDPPGAIMDALSKLTLYRIQEKAEIALKNGDLASATRHLQNLSTRLFEAGEAELGEQARREASRISSTSAIGAEAQKALKYGTRTLALGPGSSAPNMATSRRIGSEPDV
jgi:Ca-activated chloride channel family protein